MRCAHEDFDRGGFLIPRLTDLVCMAYIKCKCFERQSSSSSDGPGVVRGYLPCVGPQNMQKVAGVTMPF